MLVILVIIKIWKWILWQLLLDVKQHQTQLGWMGCDHSTGNTDLADKFCGTCFQKIEMIDWLICKHLLSWSGTTGSSFNIISDQKLLLYLTKLFQVPVIIILPWLMIYKSFQSQSILSSWDADENCLETSHTTW